MKRIFLFPLSLLILSACVHSLTIQGGDGEKLSGRYRFTREDTGLIQVIGSNGEVLSGGFLRVGRSSFVDSYKKTFGSGTIVVDGPDLPAYTFGGLFGNSYALTDAAYGEAFSDLSGNSAILVKGPLFYWTASLRGDKGTTMGCYFIGSSYTGHGFGRCKSHTGKEYSSQF
jgi:hypothetical protein